MVEASAPGRPGRRDGGGPLVTALMVAACVLLSACSAPGTAPGARGTAEALTQARLALDKLAWLISRL